MFAVLLALAGCTGAEGALAPTPTPTPTSTPVPVASPTGDAVASSGSAPAPDIEYVTFTFECSQLETWDVKDAFATLLEVWADPRDDLLCTAEPHGDVRTETQSAAIERMLQINDLMGASRNEDIASYDDQLLASLYGGCAIRSNGHLALGVLAENQKMNVEALLMICPDHPRADDLRAML